MDNMLLTSPLDSASEEQLSQCLWSWQVCVNCQKNQICSGGNCPTPRMKRLTRYFDYYRALTGMYETEDEDKASGALTSHEDLFDIIRKLKATPDIPRAELAEEIFNARQNRKPPAVVDQERAINLAVRVSAMVNCSAQRQQSGLLEHGLFQIRWRNDVTYSQFIAQAFPQTDHPTINDDDTRGPLALRAAITATKLKKRAKLSFRPTDDLRCHLLFDRKTRTVEIYHHTAFLKEQLRITKDSVKSMSVSDYLKL